MKNGYYNFLGFFTSQKSIYYQNVISVTYITFKYRYALTKLRLSNHSLNTKLGETNNQKFQESPAYDTQRKALNKELGYYSLESFPNESTLKRFMETKQDQQLTLL